MRGSSTLPDEAAEASLYQRPEKADERADIAGERGRGIPGGGTRASYRCEIEIRE